MIYKIIIITGNILRDWREECSSVGSGDDVMGRLH